MPPILEGRQQWNPVDRSLSICLYKNGTFRTSFGQTGLVFPTERWRGLLAMIFMFIGILCSFSLGCCEAHLGNICRVDIIVKWFLFVVIQNNAYYDEIITHKCYRVLVTLPCFSSPGPCYHPNSFPYSLFHFRVPLTFWRICIGFYLVIILFLWF